MIKRKKTLLALIDINPVSFYYSTISKLAIDLIITTKKSSKFPKKGWYMCTWQKRQIMQNGTAIEVARRNEITNTHMPAHV